jgi:hypothetical protein
MNQELTNDLHPVPLSTCQSRDVTYPVIHHVCRSVRLCSSDTESLALVRRHYH